jgi:hypothetical protein
MPGYRHAAVTFAGCGIGCVVLSNRLVFLGLRKGEPSSLACVGDKLYFRSASMAHETLCVVLSTDTLTEVGSVKVTSGFLCVLQLVLNIEATIWCLLSLDGRNWNRVVCRLERRVWRLVSDGNTRGRDKKGR